MLLYPVEADIFFVGLFVVFAVFPFFNLFIHISFVSVQLCYGENDSFVVVLLVAVFKRYFKKNCKKINK